MNADKSPNQLALPYVEICRIYHRDEFRLGMFFKINSELKSICKSINATYSSTYRCWYIDDSETALPTILQACKDCAFVDYKQINRLLSQEELTYAKRLYAYRKKKAAMGDAARSKQSNFPLTKPTPPQKSNQKRPAKNLENIVPESYKEKLRSRRYSKHTYHTYTSLFNRFVHYYQYTFKKHIDEASSDEIKAYLTYMVDKRAISMSTQNQIVNAIKFYYEQVLGQQREKYWIERPRKEKRLPEVISEEEVVKLIVAAGNLKHQMIVAMLYSAGLRRAELTQLRIKDLNFDRKQVFVRGGKGKKDRVSLLSERMCRGLWKYLEAYKPNYYLFENDKRAPMSGGTIGIIVKNASKRAGIKPVTPHVLRHSFATHLLDSGVSIRIIQELLGHSNLQTTQIYTHVSTKELKKIKSPLDNL